MVDAHPPLSYSRTLLVRWLSGRKQRFAKAPYSKRVPRVRIPPSPFSFRSQSLGPALPKPIGCGWSLVFLCHLRRKRLRRVALRFLLLFRLFRHDYRFRRYHDAALKNTAGLRRHQDLFPACPLCSRGAPSPFQGETDDGQNGEHAVIHMKTLCREGSRMCARQQAFSLLQPKRLG